MDNDEKKGRTGKKKRWLDRMNITEGKRGRDSRGNAELGEAGFQQCNN